MSYEFSTYLADQLGVFDKITLNYDTVDPNPGSLPHEKINTQIIVTMPEVDQDYDLVNGSKAQYKLETVYNDQIQTNTDLVEVLLKGRESVIGSTTTPHKAGKQYTSADFSPSRFAADIATKINELHPSIRTKMAGGIQDYLATQFNDLRDLRVTEAFRSKARSNKLKAAGIKAASGGKMLRVGRQAARQGQSEAKRAGRREAGLLARAAASGATSTPAARRGDDHVG